MLIHEVMWFVLFLLLIIMIRYRGFAARLLGWLWKQKVILLFMAAVTASIVEVVGLRSVIAFAPTVLGLVFQLLFALVFMVVQFGGMMWIMSRPRVKWYQPGELTMTFDDFVGSPAIKQMLMETVENIQTNTKFREMGGIPSRGILMSGPPGTGKSYGARIIASVCGIPFCLVDAASLQSAFMGMGSLTVNNLYSKARGYSRKYGACIIFLDELDAIGQSRSHQGTGMGMMGGMMMGGGGQLLNTLLTNLDPSPSDTFLNGILRRFGFPVPPADLPYVLTIGATNLPESLDAALIRDRRMDYRIPYDLPDVNGRQELFEYELRKVTVAGDLNVRLLKDDPESESAQIVRKNVRSLALQSGGFSPAAINTLVTTKGPQITARRGSGEMSMADLVSARRTRSFGMKQPLLSMTAEESRRVAYHEAGHAALSMGRRRDVIVEYATNERREGALGLVAYSFPHERYTHTQQEMLAQIESCLASRAVELEILHAPMSGFSGDLNTATRIASAMINIYGMDDILVSVPGIGATAVPAASVNRILQHRMALCRALVIKHVALVEEIAETLLIKKEMDGDELWELFIKHVPNGEMLDDEDVLAQAKTIEDAYYESVRANREKLIGQDVVSANSEKDKDKDKSEFNWSAESVLDQNADLMSWTSAFYRGYLDDNS